MSEEFDPWATSSGLVPEFDAKVNNAYFEFDPQYNDGNTLLLKMEIQSPDPEVGREGNGSDVIQFTCGTGWETKDKGATATHESGRPRNFNKMSGMGVLIESVKEHDEVLAAVRGQGEPHEAKAWAGLNLHFERKQVEGDFNGEKQSYNRLMVTGLAGDAGAATVTSGPGTVTTAAADAGNSGAGTGAGPVGAAGDLPFGGIVLLKLKKAAKAAASHDDFAEAVLTGIDGVEVTPEVEAGVLDEAVYEALKAS